MSGDAPFRLLPGRVVLAVLLAVVLSGPSVSAVSGETEWGTVATPLRMVNLNPFQLVHGVPGSFGTRVTTPQETEAILSLDIASHLLAAEAGVERVLLDGETYRLGLSIRKGFAERWEYFVDVSSVAHRSGLFDGFIENWHNVFGLPQGNRDRAPRDRLVLFYADEASTHIDIRQNTASLGDTSIGIGYALPAATLANDGLAFRASLKLPTGNDNSLAGSGSFSGSLWAETSGVLPGADEARAWLYAATLGVLAAQTPQGLPELGNRVMTFARFGITWRLFDRLTLTTQIDVHTSPYSDATVAPLADTAVILGMGGALRISEHATLEIAVTEDDGSRRAAPDVGFHAALRWNL